MAHYLHCIAPPRSLAVLSHDLCLDRNHLPKHTPNCSQHVTHLWGFYHFGNYFWGFYDFGNFLWVFYCFGPHLSFCRVTERQTAIGERH